jgi:hypothetical protein
MWDYDRPCNKFPTLYFDVFVDAFFLVASPPTSLPLSKPYPTSPSRPPPGRGLPPILHRHLQDRRVLRGQRAFHHPVQLVLPLQVLVRRPDERPLLLRGPQGLHGDRPLPPHCPATPHLIACTHSVGQRPARRMIPVWMRGRRPRQECNPTADVVEVSSDTKFIRAVKVLRIVRIIRILKILKFVKCVFVCARAPARFLCLPPRCKLVDSRECGTASDSATVLF